MRNLGIKISIAVILLAVSVPASARMSKIQIDTLRDQLVRQGATFEVGQTWATDRDMNELCGIQRPKFLPRRRLVTTRRPWASSLPSRFSWLDQGGCTPIRDQSHCGSCWAFATLATVECNALIYTGRSENLSEQHLVSCNTSGYDCDGGWWAFNHLMSGAVRESQFPYEAEDLPCQEPYERSYRIRGWGYVQGSDPFIVAVDDIKRAIMEHGPVATVMRIDNTFSAYRGGIYNIDAGSPYWLHGVNLVGWDDSQGAAGVWILRNSWTTVWGEGGYMRIEYGRSFVESDAAYCIYDDGYLPPEETDPFTTRTEIAR